MARLQGSDAKLRDEYVVYSAHLDHLGIGEPVNGKKIYNGALDYASGSATLLEIARAYSQMKPHPRRSILFVSVTGEEEGLLGSDYFAHYPTVAKDGLVANINIDGNAALLWPIEDVIPRGSEHSTLGAAAHEAADRLKLDVSPDPVPDLVFFIRSGQYSFVKQGIPSIFFSAGIKSGDPKVKPVEIITKWRQTIYHKPQDDMNQPLRLRLRSEIRTLRLSLGVRGSSAEREANMESGAMCYMLSKRGYLSDRDGSPIRGLHGRSTNCDHDRVGATGEQVP